MNLKQPLSFDRLSSGVVALPSLFAMRQICCGGLVLLVILTTVVALPRKDTNPDQGDVFAVTIDGSSVHVPRGELSRDHSLLKPFDGSLWAIGGMALVTNRFIRLTADIPSRMGSIWNTAPLMFPSWEVEIKLKIYRDDAAHYGEGMAFWYLDNWNRKGRVFGFPSVFRGLGVFIDTSEDANHEHPFISAMVNNGSMQYLHDAVGIHSQLGGKDVGCHASVVGDEEPSKILIRYATQTISVFIAVGGADRWTLCMKSEGVILPRGYHLAVSASTGAKASEFHEVISVKTFSLEPSNEDMRLESEREVISAAEMAPPRFYSSMTKRPFSFVRAAILILLPIVLISVLITFALVWYTDKISVRSKRLL